MLHILISGFDAFVSAFISAFATAFGKKRIRTLATANAAALVSLVAAPILQAEDEVLFDRYSISAQASGEVVNDLLTAQMAVEHEDRDSATLANRVNADMAWALEKIRQFPSVKATSGNYSTWPQHERKTGRIIGWRSSQVLKLESDDFPAVRKAIRDLQDRLQVRGMSLSPKVETRQGREDDLIAEALNSFRQRAALVQSTMGASDFRIINVDINTNSQLRHPAMMRSYAEADSMSKVANEPAIAAGTSEVVISVNGFIQLQ